MVENFVFPIIWSRKYHLLVVIHLIKKNSIKTKWSTENGPRSKKGEEKLTVK